MPEISQPDFSLRGVEPDKARTTREGRTWKTIQISGKDTYEYPTLLAAAHENGLVGIGILFAEVSWADKSAFVVARAYFRDGTFFDGLGDSTADNTNDKIAINFPRMAETRAVVRALTKALNAETNGAEEMSDYKRTTGAASQRAATPGAGAGATSTPRDNSNLVPPPFNSPSGDGWVCELSGEPIRDSKNYTAGQLAALSVKSAGGIFSYANRDAGKQWVKDGRPTRAVAAADPF